ncbi:MAG: TadE/TadG family type IV pilus assembly protein [Candidatus Dormiibacterota bacterium]
MGGDFEGVVRSRRTPRGRRGQAIVEFAVILPLFLFCLIGALDAGLWAVQTSAEVSAVEQAAMIASSAGSSPVSETAPDARVVTAAISGRLRSALFGTAIDSWCATDATGTCAPDSTQHCPTTPAEVQAKEGPRVVVVCVSEADPPSCTAPPPGLTSPYPPGCADSPMVTVRVIGFVASLVPPGFGPGAGAFELPTDISATTHTLRFAP